MVEEASAPDATEASTSSQRDASVELELDAMRTIVNALKPLELAARKRVVDYVLQRLGLASVLSRGTSDPAGPPPPVREGSESGVSTDSTSDEDDVDGISPIAQRWLKRNDIPVSRLAGLFSLGVDDIDLVAKSVPGKTTKEKMRSVLLLRGVAAYLGTGAPRFTHEDLKEACTHYDAYDGSNFATYIKSMASDVSGSKESGYSLTTRGLSSATELVKQLIGKM